MTTPQPHTDAPPHGPDVAAPDHAAPAAPEGPPPAGGIANLASGLVVVGLGAAGAGGAVALGLGTPAEPGAGLWPFAVCVAMAVLAGVQLLVGRRGGGGEKFSRHSWLAVVGLATLLLLTALMPVIGFEIPALLLSVVWMRFLGGESWRSALVCSLGTVAALYAIFVGALGTSIPHLF